MNSKGKVMNIIQHVVIHTAWGGFTLSRAAATELALRKGWQTKEEQGYICMLNGAPIESFVQRNDQDLVDIVRTMGDAAGKNLDIVKVSINMSIDNHDGKESVKCDCIVWPRQIRTHW